MRRAVIVGFAAVWVGALAPAAVAAKVGHVLRVGSYHGVQGQFKTIQAAVDAAKPGDWVLVGPGDYKTSSERAPAGNTDTPAGVLVTTPNVRLRGMNRNTVVVDGTKPGSPQCSTAEGDQNLGPSGDSGPLGLNGIEIWKAANVWVQNLTACNFLGGTGDAGNEVWWNGGDGSGKVGGYGYYGSYLNATTTYFKDEATAAQYGIFSSNWSGGTWDQTYASNFNDSDYYIGACQQVCNQTVDHAHGEYSALGYSGSNSGGQIVVKNSEFDNNEDGFDTNSQNGDDPAPQDGACPNNGISPITHTHSCWVFMNNFVHDNNNPNIPSAGLAAAGPVGTGMSVSGGRNDTIMNNRFENNNAWGVIFVPFLDSGPPCSGGTLDAVGPGSCLFDEWGDALINNTFTHNGSYGHATNGDFAELNFQSGHPTDCYSGNTDTSGGAATSSPSDLQQAHPSCDGSAAPANTNPSFLSEVLCDSQVELVSGVPASCPSGQYPRRTQVILHPLPSGLQTMPRVCGDVPVDPWCSRQVTKVKGCAARFVKFSSSLATGERFVSAKIRTGKLVKARKLHGKKLTIHANLGGRHRHVRVKVTEKIRVGSHRETIVFTRIYHRC
jgi:hypothetical protein